MLLEYITRRFQGHIYTDNFQEVYCKSTHYEQASMLRITSISSIIQYRSIHSSHPVPDVPIPLSRRRALTVEEIEGSIKRTIDGIWYLQTKSHADSSSDTSQLPRGTIPTQTPHFMCHQWFATVLKLTQLLTFAHIVRCVVGFTL